jgi:hypothetical protein
VFVCVLIFSFYKDNSQTGLGPLTWSHFNHRYRRSLSKYLAFLGPEGQDFSKWIWGWRHSSAHNTAETVPEGQQVAQSPGEKMRLLRLIQYVPCGTLSLSLSSTCSWSRRGQIHTRPFSGATWPCHPSFSLLYTKETPVLAWVVASREFCYILAFPPRLDL